MPPPYWRGGGAWRQLNDALQSIPELLGELVPVVAESKLAMVEHERHWSGHPEADDAREACQDICEPVWELEDKLTMKCELSILMAAIYAEELVNRFCVYNLPKELVETLEHLSPAEKLTAAASHLGHARVRSEAAYAALAELFRWRNAFAHGHCVDRPTKTLRHNHLITPDSYLHLPESITTVLRHVAGMDRLIQFLSKISINRYTTTPTDGSPFTIYADQIRAFKFTGRPDAYDVSA